MSTRVKICGITTAADLEVAVAAGADAIGVICDVPVDTPRDVSPAQAAQLIDRVPPFVTSVLVTMAATPETVLDLTDDLRPDVVQVHGDVTTTDLREIRAAVPVLRAIDSADRSTIEAVDGVVDGMLVDSMDESGAGGTGETHDWDRTRAYVDAVDTPIILAGGLTPDNVASAVRHVRPFAVDVASGVEGADGKDTQAVERFVTAAKTAAGGA